jgi:hypothetical protein
MALEGSRTNAAGDTAVTLRRAVAVGTRDTLLKAIVSNPDGSVAMALTRTADFAQSPIGATLVRERSVLVADGMTQPVIAVRALDRDGRPIHHGLVGDFRVPSPIFPRSNPMPKRPASSRGSSGRGRCGASRATTVSLISSSSRPAGR